PCDANVEITLEVNALIDDGAVIYLNGTEAERIGMPGGEITHSTYASRSITNATNETFSISPNLLAEGDNVLAVEVHQGTATSSDIVFGLTVDANITTTTVAIIPDSNSIPLDSNEYVLVVKDPNAFAERYPSVPMPAEKILGPYIGQLDNGGETVKLEDFTNSTIQEFSYSDGWYPITDGIGFSLVVIDCNDPNLDAWDDRAGWRPSAAIDGSPGADDASPVQNPGAVVINEVLAHSHGGNPDWIELHNSTEEPINIGGWFVSDDNLDLTKYEIEIGTSIPPNGYIVFYEDVNFGYGSPDPGSHTGFALSENGETVYLSSGLDGQLTGYSEDEDFGASQTGIAFGRYYKSSTDTFNFVAMSLNTPGSANAYPKVGPIVINEIMYHPEPDGGAEYIELYNIENYPVDLQEYDNEQLIYVPWKLTDGVDFTFPLGVTIPAYGYLLVVKNIGVFDAAYPGTPGGIQKFQWTSGKLANDGEKVEISMPGDMDGSERMYIRIDRINYGDKYPWPTEPDGENGDSVSSLTRIDPYLYGNDPNNWQAALPTPGE
ncbi:MAG: lamin tail domain-containing protein, partial [Planctomycetota bacterium]